MLFFIFHETGSNISWCKIENVLSASHEFTVNQKVLTSIELFAEFLITIMTHKWLQVYSRILTSWKFAVLRLFVLLQRVKCGNNFFTSETFVFLLLTPTLHALLYARLISFWVSQKKQDYLRKDFVTSVQDFLCRDKFYSFTINPQIVHVVFSFRSRAGIILFDRNEKSRKENWINLRVTNQNLNWLRRKKIWLLRSLNMRNKKISRKLRRLCKYFDF